RGMLHQFLPASPKSIMKAILSPSLILNWHPTPCVANVGDNSDPKSFFVVAAGWHASPKKRLGALCKASGPLSGTYNRPQRGGSREILKKNPRSWAHE